MEDERINDLVRMLDGDITKGVGHINVRTDDSQKESKNVLTMGCTDCSRTPLACSVPTLLEGLDDLSVPVKSGTKSSEGTLEECKVPVNSGTKSSEGTLEECKVPVKSGTKSSEGTLEEC